MQIASVIEKHTPVTVAIAQALLLVYILSFSVEGVFTTDLFGNKVQLPELIFLLFAPFAFIALLKTGAWRFPRIISIDYALLFYLFSVLAATVYSCNSNSVGELLGIIYFSSLYMIANLLLLHSGNSRAIVIFLVISAWIAALLGIVGMVIIYLGGETSWAAFYPNYPYTGDTYRAQGFLRSPILLADFLTIGLLLLLNAKNYILKKFSRIHWLVALVLLSGLLLTLTKSILLFLVVFIWVAVRVYSVKPIIKKLGYLVSIVLTIFYLFNSHFFIKNTSDRDFNAFLESPYSSHTQISIPHSTYSIIPSIYTTQKQACIIEGTRFFPFGSGGNNHIEYAKVLYAEGAIPFYAHLTPHSTYFGTFGELGIFGLLAIIFLCFTVFKEIKTLHLKKQINYISHVGYIAIALFIVLQGITMDFMNIRHYWILLIALAVKARNIP